MGFILEPLGGISYLKSVVGAAAVVVVGAAAVVVVGAAAVVCWSQSWCSWTS